MESSTELIRWFDTEFALFHILPHIAAVSVALIAIGCSLTHTSDGLELKPNDGGNGDASGDVRADVDATEEDNADAEPDPCITNKECGEPVSCAQILSEHPGVENGNYDIWVNGQPAAVYCDMAEGGWAQVVSFDAETNPCPSGWEPIKEEMPDGRFVCSAGRNNCSGQSYPADFLSPLQEYREVRGSLEGFQGHSPDGFEVAFNQINEAYVDGVSITYGDPKTHIWTLAAGLMRDHTGRRSCPCMEGTPPPLFVEDDYFCDSGNPSDHAWPNMWWIDDPLWEDGDCGSESDSSWFVKVLPAPTNHPIEVRLMADGCDDGFGISRMELYVR